MKSKEKIQKIFDSKISCHPSREDDIKAKEAIECLASDLDDIRTDIEYILGQVKPRWMEKNPYDLSNRRR